MPMRNYNGVGPVLLSDIQDDIFERYDDFKSLGLSGTAAAVLTLAVSLENVAEAFLEKDLAVGDVTINVPSGSEAKGRDIVAALRRELRRSTSKLM